MHFEGVIPRLLRRILRSAGMLGAVGFVLMATSSPGWAAKYAAIVIDANSGRVLHQSHADDARYPASLTKMMTLYIVFEMLRSGRLSYDSKLVITSRSAAKPPSKLGIKPGGSVRLVDGIRALVTKSANDVATAIAENLAGTEEKFARYMTWKARQIGMTRTVFRNASGLPNSAQTTTARDMATLGLRLMDDFPKYYKFFRLRYFKYHGHRYRNHNGLLFNFKGTNGIKTGYTRASGFNLVASVRRGRKHLIGVVMGGSSAGNRNGRMRSLLRKAFKRAATTRTRKRTTPPPVLLATRKKKRAYSGLTKADPIRLTRLVRRLVAPVPSIVSSGTQRRSSARPASSPGAAAGPFQVQVGAHSSPKAAEAVLASVNRRAGRLLVGHSRVVLPFRIVDRQWYRARFGGFTRSAAVSVCSGLKRKKIDCLVMPAE